MKQPAACILCILLLTRIAWPDPRRVEDLRCPSARITRVLLGDLPNWKPFHPTFVGDVDADGFDDFLLTLKFPQADGTSQRRTLLVYGQETYPAEVALEDLRTTTFNSVSNHGSLTPFAPASDADGDGKADFLLAPNGPSWNGVLASGQAILVFGSDAFGPDVSLGSPVSPGVRVKRFTSKEEYVRTGWDADPAGDLNGDGYTDIAISASGPKTLGSVNGVERAGRVYVILGGADPAAEEVVFVEDLGDSVEGFVLHGAYGPDQAGGHNNGDFLGYTLIGPGDLDGDGLDDLVVSAPNASRGGLQERGAVYVIYGARSFPQELFIASPETFGVEILGARSMQWFGLTLAVVGDVDQDGLQDFAVGAPSPTAPGFQGEVYLIYGARGWPSSIAVDDGALRTFCLSETRPIVPPWNEHVDFNGRLGSALVGLGDWNGDGYPDFAAAAPHHHIRLDPHVGEAYIVYGGPDLPPSATDLEVGTDALPGEVFTGTGPWQHCGQGIGGGGDLNGDGSVDFLLQSMHAYYIRGLEPDLSVLYIVHGGDGPSAAWKACEVSPPQGSVLGGDRVSIRGAGFLGTEAVRFGGKPALSVEAPSTAELLVEVPPSPTEGSVDVEVVRGEEKITLPGAFRYHRPSPYSDVVLDAATLEGSAMRTLEIRDVGGRTFGFLVRQFASTYFGDLNGDGLDDLVIAARYDGEEMQGVVSVLFGARDLPKTIEWEEIPEWGTVIVGSLDQRSFGVTIALPGDLDGDSFPDLAIGGALRRGGSLAIAYVIRGRPHWEPRLDIDEQVESGLAVAIPQGICGTSHVERGGDLTGEGLPAFLVETANCDGAAGTIEVYTQGIFADRPIPAPAVITGDPIPRQDQLPRFKDLALAGDLNGDGHLDIAVGSSNELFGEVFLLLGGSWDFLQASVLDFLEEDRGVRLRHRLWGNEFGERNVPAGDFNGDGLADVLLGAPSGGDAYHGESYILFGNPDLGTEIRELEVRPGTPGILQLSGEYSRDYAGSVASLGDLNRDGYSDVGIVSSSHLVATSRAYVVLGEADPPDRLSLGALGERGFTIRGTEGHWFSGGYGPMAAGDMDGDGLTDIAIGEHTAEGKRVVVIFGVPPSDHRFLRGDANDDGQLDLSDAVSILGHLFLGTTGPPCTDAADGDDNGELDITDAIYLLGHLISRRPRAAASLPGARVGPDGGRTPLRAVESALSGGLRAMDANEAREVRREADPPSAFRGAQTPYANEPAQAVTLAGSGGVTSPRGAAAAGSSARPTASRSGSSRGASRPSGAC